ncbi:MAG: C25 family cysteine peptidase [Saprospiraceae bacterium]|nr:C25 family cysteine peptidase [Saprospiraceae bacterium]
MKNLPHLFILYFLGICFMGNAQNHDGRYGNEWINYNQQYFKASIAQDGFYRITKQVLDNAGIPTNSVNPSNFQVFALGNEIPIYVKSNNGVVEYIEFYATKHHGELDEGLYYDASHHFNKEYSVINDTLGYYVTWGNAASTEQYTEHSPDFTPPLPAAESYVWSTSKTVFNSTWNKGKLYQVAAEKLSKSTFDYGEGFGSIGSSVHNINVNTPNVYTAGPNSKVRVQVYAHSTNLVQSTQHDVLMTVNGTTILSQTFSGSNRVDQYASTVASNQLTTSSLVRLQNTFPDSRFYVAHAEIEYPRTLDLGGEASLRFKMEASVVGVGRQILEFTNINSGNANAQNLLVYDLTNKVRSVCLWDPVNNKATVSLPPSSTERELLFINLGATGSYSDIGILNSINTSLVNYGNFVDKDYIIITHPSLEAKANEYAIYRQFLSPTNSGYDPIVVNVEDLYNQFAYGVRYHPLAIRNFAAYIKSTWTNPEYLFIIGKGRQYVNTRISKPDSLLVPTFGFPESDMLLVAPINSRTPMIPVGRLSATTPNQVDIYLNKIKDHETQVADVSQQNFQGKIWTKNILHLGGGSTVNEQFDIQSYLNNMKTIAEGVSYGANVESFFKTTSAPIQTAQSYFLDSLINSGVSLITFFGHSSANSFDFNLDYPENYNNYQKYPMIMALGCYGGTMFTSGRGLSERFVLEPDAGASVFFASVGAASLSSLGEFANTYYTHMGGNYYGEGAGKIAQQTIATMEQGSFGFLQEMVCGYMAYHGDPAFNLNMYEYPDYYTDQQLISHSPSLVTTKEETFELNINTYNLGRAMPQGTTFFVDIERTYPNGDVEFVTKAQVVAPYYNSIYTLQIPVNGGDPKTLGLNKFRIKIDADDELDERPNPQAEDNNYVYEYDIYILSDAITPVFPYEFAIVPDQNITLKASTGLAFSASAGYIIQIDTTEYFDSPIKQETVVTQIGGVVEWTPNLSYEEERVYYWRVSPDTIGTSNAAQWAYSSFIYMNGSYPGWNQSHFFQYKKDDFQNLVLPEGLREFDYISSFQELELQNGFTPTVLNEFDVKTSLNGSLVEKCRCANQRGVYVQVLDEDDLDVWFMPPNSSQYGAINCDAAPRNNFMYLFQTNTINAAQNSATQDDLVTFLSDTIPDGAYVLIFTLNDAGADAWNTNLVNHLTSIGVDPVDLNTLTSTSGGLPFGFFYKKGHPTYPHIVTELAPSANDIISLSGIIEGNWVDGRLSSTLIGPATNWQELHWQTSNSDGLLTDYTHVDVYGITSSGTEQVLIQNLTNLDTNLTFINATLYPYLRLEWFSEDATHQSPPQLDYWRIIADMAPEAAIRPDLHLVANYDTVERGEPFFFEVAMENLTGIDMDSMLIKFQVVGDSNAVYKRIAPLTAEDTLQTYISINTENLYGAQELLVDINPNFDQIEQYRFNNIGLYSFFVQADNRNPVLDVTFDGVRIMDGDLISGKPEIMISLDDDNRYLALNDLDDFTAVLFHRSFVNGQLDLKEIEVFEFVPADPAKLRSENKAMILATPDLPFDGTYTLYVSAKDRSNNNSGDLTYSINFEVINKPSVSNVLNYPNPFTTSTQFVFTLTGRELPDEMKIQIFTVSGRLVREIGMDELGELHIGTNRTEFAWDGTDMYGDRLANGVYLYRVITVKEGEEYEQFNNSQIDHMFRQGFGKMYLMR